MQRVKPRRVQQHSDEEYIEDVVESETDSSSITSAQPLINTKPTEVFAARQEDTVPLRSPGVEEDEAQMVTIVNTNVKESKLDAGEQFGLLQVDTRDHPISLVYANNEHPFIEDIPTPSPSLLVTDPLKLRKEGTDQSIEMVKMNELSERIEETPENDYVVEDAWKTPENINHSEEVETEIRNEEVQDEARDMHQDEAREMNQSEEGGAAEAEYANDSEEPVEYYEPAEVTDGYQELPQADDKVDKKTAAPEIDEYGNVLDENGHPILDVSFPDDWVLQPDQGDGIVRYETGDGQVRFIMELGYDFPDPPNVYKLEMDCYVKQIPTTHRIASQCEFFVDNGIWRLQLDAEVVNVLKRMDIAQDFENLTGESLWNTSKDVTVENLTKAMTIYKDSELHDNTIRMDIAKDSVYNPKDNIFKLSDGSSIVNVTNNMTIAKGMDFVESKNKVSIPHPHNTEFHDHSQFLIYEDSEFTDPGEGNRHLDSGGCEVLESVNQFVIIEDSKLEDQGTRHLLAEDAILEDQGKRHLICEGSKTVDIVREHRHAEDASVVDIKGFQLVDDGDKVDIKRHYLVMDQDINRTPAVWTEANFDGKLVDLTDKLRLETDMKIEISPSTFNLNQIDLDDEFLAELEDEE